jgi:hypothetical protein
VNRPDDRVRHGSQKALDKVSTKDWRSSCLSNAARIPARISSFEELLQTRHTQQRLPSMALSGSRKAFEIAASFS